MHNGYLYPRRLLVVEVATLSEDDDPNVNLLRLPDKFIAVLEAFPKDQRASVNYVALIERVRVARQF
jgi:hypothetical protein